MSMSDIVRCSVCVCVCVHTLYTLCLQIWSKRKSLTATERQTKESVEQSESWRSRRDTAEIGEIILKKKKKTKKLLDFDNLLELCSRDHPPI